MTEDRIGSLQTDQVQALLNTHDRMPCGTHRVDDPMLVIDLEPGDREKVLRVTFDNNDPAMQPRSPSLIRPPRSGLRECRPLLLP